MFMGSSIYYHPLMVTCYLSYPMWLWECQVHIDGLQMTCIRCAIDILGAQQKQLISIIILDSHLGIHLVLVISSVQIIIVMITISIGGGGGVHCSKWIGSTLILLLVGSEAPVKSILECKIYHSTHVRIVLCHAHILYVHSYNLFDLHGLYSFGCAWPHCL